MTTDPVSAEDSPALVELTDELDDLREQLRQANEHIDRLRIALADNTWAMASRRRKLAAKVRHAGGRVRDRLLG